MRSTGDERSFRPLQEAAEPGQQRGPVQPGGQQAERRVQAVVGGEGPGRPQGRPRVGRGGRRHQADGGGRGQFPGQAVRGFVAGVRGATAQPAAVRGDHTQATEPRTGDRAVASGTAEAHRVVVREPERSQRDQNAQSEWQPGRGGSRDRHLLLRSLTSPSPYRQHDGALCAFACECVCFSAISETRRRGRSLSVIVFFYFGKKKI